MSVGRLENEEISLSKLKATIAAITLVACATPEVNGTTRATSAGSVESPSTVTTLSRQTTVGATTTSLAPSPLPEDDEFAILARQTAGGNDPSASALNAFWEATVADSPYLINAYEPPTLVVGYRSGFVPESPCSAGTTPRYWASNARYCQSDATILFDEDWLRDFSDRFGTFAPSAVLAHEWGHHLQNFIDRGSFPIQQELQADCLSGMYLASADGSNVGGEFVDDKLDASLETFFEIGNAAYQASEWFGASEHGSSLQRIMAVGTGYLASTRAGLTAPSLEWCGGYSKFEPEDFAVIGEYVFLNFPGREGRWLDGTYELEPSDLGGSSIRMTWLDELPIPDVGASREQLAAVIDVAFPNAAFITVNDVSNNVASGSAVAGYYQIPRVGDPPVVIRGFVALVTPVDQAGALLIEVLKAVPPNEETSESVVLAFAEEQVTTLYLTLGRLCGPDELSTDAIENVVCLRAQ